MWKRPGCTLTKEDFDILRRMLEEHQDHDEAMTSLLRQKLETAQVVCKADMPDNVVTIDSRISFRLGNGMPETRIISRDRSGGSVSYFLPITTMRGLALLGLAEGQTAAISRNSSLVEILQVTAIHYQPERTERLREAEEAIHPGLRHAETSREADHVVGRGRVSFPEGDDPGPSAA